MDDLVFFPVFSYSVRSYNRKIPQAEYNNYMSDKQVTLRKKIQHLFIPQFEGSRESFQELIPIFFMITVVMSGLYIMNMMISTVEYSPLRLIVFTLLFLVHMLLYWMILNFAQTERRTVLYLASQGMLIFVIVLVGGNFFLALGLFASISGTAVGTLGNKRLAIIGIFFYIILAIVNVLLLSNFEILRGLLPTFLGAVLFAAFFAYLFSRQVEAHGTKGDVLIAFSTSGKSNNVIQALRTAKSQGLNTVSIVGQYTKDAAGFTDVLISIPVDDTPRVQEVHGVICHVICEYVENSFSE